MTYEEIFEIWSPGNSLWSTWAKPVLFAHLGVPFVHPPGGEILQDAGWAAMPDENFAIVLDLPGAEGVWTGVGLAAHGYRPVPLYNALPLPFGSPLPDPLPEASIAAVNVLPIISVYSNTGGQASKSTPRGAVAKFAAAGKSGGKKDLGMIATAYGNVYVAQIAMGADMPQTVKALAEAEAHRGPSLVIAYSHCIAHGIDMSTAMSHQKEAVDSGYWPLYRFDPRNEEAGERALRLDSKKPSIPLKAFTSKEARYAMLARSDPDRAERLAREAQADVDARRHLYEQLAGVDRSIAPDGSNEAVPEDSAEGGARRMTDLRTRYLGLDLANPIVPSASPLGQRIETLRRLQDAGASAVVLPSLFEEQIEHEEMQIHGALEAGADSFAEAPSYMPAFEDYNTGSEAYLRHVEATKAELEIPVIASLNGISMGGWTKHARRLQDAGADALELNVYFIAADPDESGAAVERRYVDLVEAVRSEITIPLAVKIGPFFSSVGHTANRLVEAGADGLVLFNRFMQPDIDLDTLRVDPTLTLSTSDELRLPLRWIGILHGRIHASIAATTGVHTSGDALKMLLAGADVVMMASALLHDGPEHVAVVLREIEAWMDEREYDVGRTAPRLDEPGQHREPGRVRTRELRAARDVVREPVRLADAGHRAARLSSNAISSDPMTTDDLRSRIAADMPRTIADLERLVRIPSKGYPGDDPANVRASAEATRDILIAAGVADARLLEARRRSSRRLRTDRRAGRCARRCCCTRTTTSNPRDRSSNGTRRRSSPRCATDGCTGAARPTTSPAWRSTRPRCGRSGGDVARDGEGPGRGRGGVLHGAPSPARGRRRRSASAPTSR